MTSNPCFKCEDRTAGCHSTCKRYLEWQRIHQKELDQRREELAMSDVYLAYAKRRASQRKKRKHEKE